MRKQVIQLHSSFSDLYLNPHYQIFLKSVGQNTPEIIPTLSPLMSLDDLVNSVCKFQQNYINTLNLLLQKISEGHDKLTTIKQVHNTVQKQIEVYH